VLYPSVRNSNPKNYTKRFQQVNWSEAKCIMIEWRKGLMTKPISWLLLCSYSIISFINTNLYNCSCDCVFSFCVRVFIECVILCTVFRLIVVLYCVMCVVCVFCLIVLPLPPGENPFAVKINNIIILSLHTSGSLVRRPAMPF
jgi:hypothetical protein